MTEKNFWQWLLKPLQDYKFWRWLLKPLLDEKT